IVDHLGDPVTDLPFTQDGLAPLLRSARISYLVGTVYKSCNLPEKAAMNFKKATAQWNLESATWAWKASRQIPGSDPAAAEQKLESILSRAKTEGDATSRSGWLLYNVGLLEHAMGQTQQARRDFRQALLSTDQLLSYHLARLALSSDTQ